MKMIHSQITALLYTCPGEECKCKYMVNTTIFKYIIGDYLLTT